MRLTEPTLNGDRLLVLLRQIVGTPHVLVAHHVVRSYTRGHRPDIGIVRAVIRPRTLVEFWRVADACVAADQIVVVQPAAAGVVDGSVLNKSGGARPVIMINTCRLRGLHILAGGKQVICLPGTTPHRLETCLAKFGRAYKPEQRDTAETGMILAGRVTGEGRLELINHLGIKLNDNPIEALGRLERGAFQASEIEWPLKGSGNTLSGSFIRESDPKGVMSTGEDHYHLGDSDCSDSLIIFALRVKSAPIEKMSEFFYIATNETEKLEALRHHFLKEYGEMPLIEAMTRSAAAGVSKSYGGERATSMCLTNLRCLSYFLADSGWVALCAAVIRCLPASLAEFAFQKLSKLAVGRMSARVSALERRFEHHLMIRIPTRLTERFSDYLKNVFLENEGTWFVCSPQACALAPPLWSWTP